MSAAKGHITTDKNFDIILFGLEHDSSLYRGKTEVFVSYNINEPDNIYVYPWSLKLKNPCNIKEFFDAITPKNAPSKVNVDLFTTICFHFLEIIRICNIEDTKDTFTTVLKNIIFRDTGITINRMSIFKHVSENKT